MPVTFKYKIKEIAPTALRTVKRALEHVNFHNNTD